MASDWLFIVLGVFAFVMWLAVFLAMTADKRAAVSASVLWWLVGLYPCVFAVLAGRAKYSSDTDTDTPLSAVENLGVVPTLVALVTFTVCLVGWTSVVHVRRAGVETATATVSVLFFGSIFVSDLAVGGGVIPVRGATLVILVVLTLYTLREPVESLILRLRRILRVYVWGSLVAVLLAQSWALVPSSFGGREWLPTRLIGLTSSTNYMALLAALSVILEVSTIKRSSHWRIYALVALGVCTWAQGRTALLAVVLGVGAVWVTYNKIGWRSFGTYCLTSIGIVSVVIVYGFEASVKGAVGRVTFDGFTSGRISAWGFAWDTAQEHAWLGYGSQFFDETYWQSRGLQPIFANAHNQVLQAWGEGGILRVFLMIILLFVLAAATLRQSARTGGASLGVFFVIIAQLPFGTPLHVEGLSWNLIPLACCLGLAFVSQESRSVQTERSSLVTSRA